MKTRFAASLLALILAGCVHSIHPLYTEDVLRFEQGLIGKWQDEDNADTLFEFSKNGGRAYRMIHTDDGKTGRFDAHLVRLNGELFLDLFPETDDLEPLERNAFYKWHLMPVHTFMHLRLKGDSLQMRVPDPSWMKKHLRANPGAITHVFHDDDTPLLTAPPKKLQAFLRKHLESEGAFDDPTKLRRLK